jgi:hypothetical protein
MQQSQLYAQPLASSSVVGLRVTNRCCVEDLGEPPGTPVADLAERHPIVVKFQSQRGQEPRGARPIGHLKQRNSIDSLHSGRYRGATWYDEEYGVVWLLGFGIHKSRNRDDAYQEFLALDEVDRLLPDKADYEALFRERNTRFVPLMVLEVTSLLELARREQAEEHSALLSEGLRVTLLVDQIEIGDEILEEIWFAISVRNLEKGWLNIVRTALLPDQPPETWEFTKTFPNRGESRTELRFRHCHAVEARA